MFLNREKPETDDFVKKKISGCERKILSRNFIISSLADILSKMSENFFAYSCVSENSKHLFSNQNLHFL